MATDYKIFQGQIVGIVIDGNELACNTDVTVSLTKNLTEDPACKPLSTDAYTEGGWVRQSITSKTGTITGTALSVADVVTGAVITDADILDLFLTTDRIEVVVRTTPVTNYQYQTVRTLTATCIINEISWNNPSDATSSSDFTFTIDGEPTYDSVPYVS